MLAVVEASCNCHAGVEVPIPNCPFELTVNCDVPTFCKSMKFPVNELLLFAKFINRPVPVNAEVS